MIVLGTTGESGRVPANLLSCFKQEVAFEVSRFFFFWLIKVEHYYQAPNEGERLEILECLLGDHTIASDVSVENLATQTAALLAGDLQALVVRAKAASIERAANAMCVFFCSKIKQRSTNMLSLKTFGRRRTIVAAGSTHCDGL